MNQPNVKMRLLLKGWVPFRNSGITSARSDSYCSKKSAWVRALPVKIEFFNVRYQSERVQLKASSRRLNEGFA